MIALIDYGIGNLRSVQKALEHVGAEVVLTDDSETILKAEKVVLPGVGAFGDGMKGLQARGLDGVVCEVVRRGTPLLGICVGMQVLFEVSEELGLHVGLGLLPGRVVRFAPRRLKVPHTGWNEIAMLQPSNLFCDLPSGSFAYFNHAYYCAAAPEHTLAATDYGESFAAVVGRGRLYGIQFHPEKSQAVGLTLLRNFVERG